MAIALVGTIGAVSQGAAGAAVTPAFGTSENRTAGNLLICWVAGDAVATAPTTPSGWSVGKTVTGTSCAAAIFYKIAAGADAAPTIAAVTSQVWAARLAEYSGNNAVPLDQVSSATGTTSPIVATNGSADVVSGELMVVAAADFYSTAATKTLTHTLNNATATSTSNASTSTVSHYDFAYGVTTTNASADSDSYAFTTNKITGSALVLCSFKPTIQFTKALTGTLSFFVDTFTTLHSPAPPPYVRRLPLPWELLPR